tara:strand:+ start:295 stop:1158 length:864 start_codon:yes stop_codon:yes gene_type:complete
MKKVIYSVMIGGYDDIRPVSESAGWERVMFTDMPLHELPAGTGWQFRSACLNKGVNNVMINRWYKMHPHELFPEYDESIYIDANIEIKCFDAIDQNIPSLDKAGVNIAITDHIFRDCIYDEALAVVEHKKDTQENVDKTIAVLTSKHYPRNNGLYENNFIYRRHHDEKVVGLMRHWWRFINEYSARDQLSLCYLINAHSIKAACFFGQGVNVRNHQDITFYPNHKKNSVLIGVDIARETKKQKPESKLMSVKKGIFLLLCNLVPGKKTRARLRKVIREKNNFKESIL